MGLQPIGDRIIVRREAAESKTSGGIILPDTAQNKPQRGKIVAVGPVGLVRYNTDGSLDTTFNAGGAQRGVVPITAGNLDNIDLVIQPDGKLLIGGATAGGKTMVQLLRFNPNGTPDATFGPGGADGRRPRPERGRLVPADGRPRPGAQRQRQPPVRTLPGQR